MRMGPNILFILLKSNNRVSTANRSDARSLGDRDIPEGSGFGSGFGCGVRVGGWVGIWIWVWCGLGFNIGFVFSAGCSAVDFGLCILELGIFFFFFVVVWGGVGLSLGCGVWISFKAGFSTSELFLDFELND